jgi:tetratricopeptide (TPR) repeat protein
MARSLVTASMIWLALVVGAGYPQALESDFDRGVLALKSGDFARAKRIFSLVVKQDPSAENLYYLAMAEANSGNVEQAILHFRQSVRMGNRSAGVHYNLGLAYLKAKRSDTGIRELRTAVATDPKYLLAKYALGVALVNAGQPADGILHLKGVVESNPHAADAWAQLVRAYFALGDWADALETADRATTQIPEDTRLPITLADLCIRNKQLQKGRYLLENASGLQPENAQIKLLLAKASLLAGEPVEALAVLKEVPAEDAQPGEVLLLLGQAQALMQHFDAAEFALTSAVKAAPGNAKYLVTLAWLNQMQGRYGDALQVLTNAQALAPLMPYISYRMGVSYFFLGRYDEAAAACEHAIQSSSEFDRAFFLLGTVRLEQGQLGAARAALEQATRLEPESDLYHRQLGVAEFKSGDYEKSRGELDRALSINPKAAEAYLWRGKLVGKQGHIHEGIDDLEIAITLQPKLRDAYTELADLYSAEGQPDKALAMAAMAKGLAASDKEDEIGRSLRDLGDPLQ